MHQMVMVKKKDRTDHLCYTGNHQQQEAEVTISKIQQPSLHNYRPKTYLYGWVPGRKNIKTCITVIYETNSSF